MIGQRFEGQAAEDGAVLADAVKHHYFILHREADDGEQGGQEERVDLPAEELPADGSQREHHQHVVDHGDDGADTVAERVLHAAEGKGDIENHRQGCHCHREDRTLGDFPANSRADAVRAVDGDAIPGGRFELANQLSALRFFYGRRTNDECICAGGGHLGVFDAHFIVDGQHLFGGGRRARVESDIHHGAALEVDRHRHAKDRHNDQAGHDEQGRDGKK